MNEAAGLSHLHVVHGCIWNVSTQQGWYMISHLCCWSMSPSHGKIGGKAIDADSPWAMHDAGHHASHRYVDAHVQP